MKKLLCLICLSAILVGHAGQPLTFDTSGIPGQVPLTWAALTNSANHTGIVWTNDTIIGYSNGVYTASIQFTNGTVVISNNLAIIQKLTSYNGAATAGGGLVASRAAVHLTGQSAAIGSTTIFTVPSGTHYYVILPYVEVTTAGSGGTISLSFPFTSGNGIGHGAAVGVTTGAVTSSGSPAYIPAMISCQGGTTLSYQTTFNGVTGSPVYSVDFFITEL